MNLENIGKDCPCYEVDYFGYDPTNRYDKWLWLDINNAYEKLGS